MYEEMLALRRSRWLAAAFVAASLLAALPALGQLPVPSPPLLGDRVRIWTKIDTMSGILTVRGLVTATRPDTLIIDEEGGEHGRVIPLALVTRIDLSRGVLPRRQGVIRGARRGLIVGLVIAPLAFFEHWHPGDGIGGIAKTAAGSAAFTGGIGIAVGGFLGTAVNHTRWVRVPIPRG